MKQIYAMILAGVVASASAFDGSRKGFVLGAGAGGHLATTTEKVLLDGIADRATDNRFGLSSDFLLGYGFNSKFMLLYQNSGTWYRSHGDLLHGDIGPVGFRYYPTGDEPGFFVGASGALGSLVNRDEFEGAGGYGFTLTYGYEIKRHLSVELKISHMSVEKDALRQTSNSIALMIEGLAY